MAKRQIIIDLGSGLNSEADVSWVVVEQGQRAGPVFRGDLKTAANHAAGCKVSVLVPGSEIYLTEVDLPVMNRQRLMKAIPFALEEAVATDLEDLHFALGRRTERNTLSVAVVDRFQVDHWLERLKHAGIQADVLCSMVFGVPVADKVWTLFLTGSGKQDLTLLRQAEQMGMSLELQNVLPYLTLAIEQCDVAQRPDTLRLIRCDADADFGLENAAWNQVEDNTLQLEAEFEPEDLAETETETERDSREQRDWDIERNADSNRAQQWESETSPGAEQSADLTLPLTERAGMLDGSLHPETSQSIGPVDEAIDEAIDESIDESIDETIDKTIDETMVETTASSAPSTEMASTTSTDNEIDTADVVGQLNKLCEANGIRIEQAVHNDAPLLYYAEHIVETSPLNILQGEYSRKEQLEKLFRPWIPAAAVAASWLLIQGGLLVENYFALAEREADLKQQMDAIYAEAFPEAKATKFHLREMEGRLAKLKTGDTKQSGLIPLLHQTGQVLKETKSMTISGLRYKANKIDLTLEISDLQALDSLKENLTDKADVKVEIVSASARNGKVNSRLQIEPKT